jgi:hypothetical protein
MIIVESRIAGLLSQPIVASRDLNTDPITPQEILDCLLLTAALNREHVEPIKRAVQAMVACASDIADICKRSLFKLRHLPSVPLIDHVNFEDRLTEMRAAWQGLHDMVAANPAQAEWLNAAAEAMETRWPSPATENRI